MNTTMTLSEVPVVEMNAEMEKREILQKDAEIAYRRAKTEERKLGAKLVDANCRLTGAEVALDKAEAALTEADNARLLAFAHWHRADQAWKQAQQGLSQSELELELKQHGHWHANANHKIALGRVQEAFAIREDSYERTRPEPPANRKIPL